MKKANPVIFSKVLSIVNLLIISIVFIISIPERGFAQGNKQEELIRQFETFSNKFQQQHKYFIDKNDSIFIQFLKASWKKVSLYNSESRQPKKPDQQPKYIDTLLKTIELIPDTAQTIIENLPTQQMSKQLFLEEAIGYSSISFLKEFNFYGISTSFEVKSQLLPRLKGVSPESITEFYIGLSKNNDYWKEQLQTLQAMKIKHQLNDWGYYQLSTKASQVFYGDADERKLLSWYFLLKSGFKAKVGFTDEQLFIIVPTTEKLYSVPYFKQGEEVLYVIDESKGAIRELETYDQQYPGSQKVISFSLNQFPLLQGDKLTRQVKYKNASFDFTFNKSVLDFLSSYPQCELKVYFKPTISQGNLMVLDQYFKQNLTGKSKREAIDFFLDFCQFAFPYATDLSQFGKERYLFAEESLFFPANDCEDRTVFLSFLMRRYLNLHTIALDFPDHVNLGVNLNETISGSFVTYRGAKYLICDPTYINAKSGMLSSVYSNQKVKIINVDQ